MTLGYVLAAVICLDQAYRSVKQLKKYNSAMFVSTLKYYLFVFSNCLNIISVALIAYGIISVALIAYGIFKDHGLILPAGILWLFNWHLFTYYAAEINKNAGKSLINIIRIITGVLVVVGICAQVFGFFK